MRRSAIVAFIASLIFASATLAQDLQFPTLKAEDLNGEAVTLPGDLPGDPTLVLIAFFREQQADVDTWINALDLKSDDAPPFVELPVVGWRNRPFKGFIDGGMRSGIVAVEDRARTITIYSSRKDLLASFERAETDRIYALVVAQDGAIKAVEEGRYTPEKAASLLPFFF